MHRRGLLLSLAVFLLLGGGLLWLEGWLLAPWRSKTLSCTAEDGRTLTISLQGRTVSVSQGDSVFWQSPPQWKVEDILWGDMMADGTPELILLCWRRGSFGPSRPFWVKSNDSKFSQHLFFLGVEGEAMRQRWCSSALWPQVDWAELRPSPRGGELLAIRTRQGEDTLWAWRGFGLVRLDGPGG